MNIEEELKKPVDRKIVEQRIKIVGEALIKRAYPETSLYSLMDKFGSRLETLHALAILCQDKFIRISEGKKWWEHSVILQDPNTNQDLVHEMIDDGLDSEFFGCLFYDRKNRPDCFEHLELRNGDPNCKKCFDELASCVCVRHNQSLPFCKICKLESRSLKSTIKESEENPEDVIKKILDVRKDERGLKI